MYILATPNTIATVFGGWPGQ